MQRADFSTLKFYLSKLTKYYRDRIQSCAWPAALSNSSSLLALTPAPKPTAITTPEPSADVQALAAALMSKLLSTAPSPPRSTNYQPSKRYPCTNCGASDHWYKDCPQPKQPKSASGSRSNSRPGSCSNSRPNSHPGSRGNSKDSARNCPSNNSNGTLRSSFGTVFRL
jgi:hypothetical protein